MVLVKILDKLAERSAAKHNVVFGPGWHDPELASALPAVRAGDIDAGLALLATDDPDLRALRVEFLSGASGSLLEALESRMGDHEPDLLLWAGAARVKAAWDVRTAAWAQDVGEERFARFHAVLRPAFEPLVRAAQLSPRPDAWSELQWFGLGMGMPREELDHMWERIRALDPEYRGAHYSRMQVLCHKWKGSHEEMFAFAREAALDARPGDQVLELVPRAHIERFAILRRETEYRTYGDLRNLAREYFTDGSVMGEVTAAADLWLRGGPDHPRHRQAAHSFGAVLHWGGQERYAAQALSLAGNQVPQDSLWALTVMNPLSVYIRTRRRLDVPL